MNFRQFEALYWIGRLGSFHAAARHLRTSQPAISARIRELEQVYDVVIFDRSERRVRTTPKGALLMEHAVRLMEIEAGIRESLRRSGAVEGRVRLGTTAISGLTWVPLLIDRLKAAHPGVVVEMAVDSSATLQSLLERRLLDIAVVAGPLSSSRLAGEPLGPVAFEWLASPALGLPAGPLTAVDLAAFPIISDRVGTPLHANIVDWFRVEGVEPRVHHTASHVAARLQLALRGVGVAAASAAAATAELARGALVRVPTTRPLPVVDYVVAVADPVVSTIVGLVADAIRQLLGADGRLDSFYPGIAETDPAGAIATDYRR